MSRLLEALQLASENAATPTHPAGCMAVTGWDDTPDDIRWIIRVSLCDHDHPATRSDLLAQYDAQGWQNLDCQREHPARDHAEGIPGCGECSCPWFILDEHLA